MDCIFCGQQKPASEEDVVPKWIRRTLNLSSEVIIRADPTGATARTQHLRITLQNMVCEACNNTWMSRLEKRVKPLLEPMLTNKYGVDLDAAQQCDLARWTVMKVLLMEYAMRQRRAHLRAMTGYLPSEPELAWLTGTMILRPVTSLAGRVRRAKQGGCHHTVQADDVGFSQRCRLTGTGNLTTLTIGYVLLQVFSTNFVLADKEPAADYDLNPPWP